MASSDPLALRQWDVVILPFPYMDRSAQKRRPALVVSDSYLHRSFGLVWVAMITSAANPPLPCDIAIADLEQAGLPAPSIIRPAKLAVIETSRVLRRVGRLDAPGVMKVAAEMNRMMGG
jgi:mRNA interferase MazF